MSATTSTDEPSVTITVGGRWCDGAIEGGGSSAPRRISLDDPVTIGRDPIHHIRLPCDDDRVSGLAAVLVPSDCDVKVHVTNRPGAVLLGPGGNVWRLDSKENLKEAPTRQPMLVHDGYVLWFPPARLDPGIELELEGGYWLALHLPDTAVPARPDDQPPPIRPVVRQSRTDLRSRRRDGGTFKPKLNQAQKVILTAVYAEYVAPIPGRLHGRPSTSHEIAAMVWSVPDFRNSKPNLKQQPGVPLIEGRVARLISSLERQTKTALPDEPGVPINQRLADWCDLHVPPSWFDVDLARRLLEARPAGRPPQGSQR